LQTNYIPSLGAHEVAGIAGYSVGNLSLPGLPHNPDWTYPNNFASPLKILLEASDGASDYGNKFGEPLIGGFTRSYGASLPCGMDDTGKEKMERIEYVKPIMFSGGLGFIDESQLYKATCQPGISYVGALFPTNQLIENFRSTRWQNRWACL